MLKSRRKCLDLSYTHPYIGIGSCLNYGHGQALEVLTWDTVVKIVVWKLTVIQVTKDIKTNQDCVIEQGQRL